MGTQKYDVIVVGLGAMGSATAYHLARRGYRVLDLDANPRRHKNGSSHGTSRIIREAYLEGADYVPLVQRAYELWRELEAESGQHLLNITGCLTISEPQNSFVSGALASCRRFNLPHEYLSAAEVNRHFPGYTLSENLAAVFEPNGGYLLPEECVLAHLDLALRHGAEIHHEEPVLKWSAPGENEVVVETAQGTYSAERLVITTGPWASELLAELGIPLKVWRIVNAHFEPDEPARFLPEVFPVYLLEVPEGKYYGFPALPGEGLKLGRHDIGELCTPQTINREVAPSEIEQLKNILDKYMRGGAAAFKWSLTCMYTLTPDRNFVLDRHPGQSNVVYGCGFSGHGFKFAAAIGEVLAELAVDGRSQQSIEFLSAARFNKDAKDTQLIQN
ncbi:MAG: N-methyl-L-tryptophan oxidase [Chloroflexi bacterium]|nr:N-methyl-L-tryptophan oxidase [Chloroflexota bacterium]OJV90073.1 MAG: N-methyltryptophan oxidase [Chloroflexi bacterium 54-19]